MITVLQSFSTAGVRRNPYLTQLVASLPDDVSVLYWSWKSALTGGYDVLHLHWPEALIRRDSRWKSLLAKLTFAAVLLRLSLSPRKLVRTVHNTAPHEVGNCLEGILLKWCDSRTDLWIELNDTRISKERLPRVMIPHGHYRDHYRGAEAPPSLTGRLLYFGLVRPYKGVLDLLEAFRDLSDRQLELHIVGLPNTISMRRQVESACAADTRARARLDYVADDELLRAIGESELVILPYRDMYNSGAMLLALSINRPVLVPETAATTALAAEVGRDWVLTYRGGLTRDELDRGIGRLRERRRADGPDLSARNWPGIGMAHRSAYLVALDRSTSNPP